MGKDDPVCERHESYATAFIHGLVKGNGTPAYILGVVNLAAVLLLATRVLYEHGSEEAMNSFANNPGVRWGVPVLFFLPFVGAAVYTYRYHTSEPSEEGSGEE